MTIATVDMTKLTPLVNEGDATTPEEMAIYCAFNLLVEKGVIVIAEAQQPKELAA